MLTCMKCNAAFDLEDYRDVSDMNPNLCPACKQELDEEMERMEDSSRFENDAVSYLEDEMDPSDLEDALSGPDDDEIDDDYDPNGDNNPPWDDDDMNDGDDDDSGDMDRDDF